MVGKCQYFDLKLAQKVDDTDTYNWAKFQIFLIICKFFAIFESKNADSFSWRRGEILAREKNGGKRMGKNKGVRRFSLFYSSLGAE